MESFRGNITKTAVFDCAESSFRLSLNCSQSSFRAAADFEHVIGT